MKTHITLACTTLILTLLAHSELKGSDPLSAGAFRQSARDQLQNNILPFWLTHSIDPRGGFHGRLALDGTPLPNAPKGLVLNTRILWTFSAAHMFESRPEYVQTARRAYDYFCARFWDPEHGGAYWLLDSEGKPVDDGKELYGQSFAVYALAEYYRATRHQPAIDKAVELYNLIEAKAHDPINKGYRETFSRDWTCAPAARLAFGEKNATKTMNAHLHMLEAYTNLYRAWPDPRLAASLRELIVLFRDRILDPETHHFRLFFDDAWKPTSDTISFGHDIEGAWLLTEAAEVLGDHELAKQIEQRSIRMAEACYKKGLDTDGSLFYEGEPHGITDKQKSWWAQAETVVGFINAYQLTKDEKYLAAAQKAWQFILTRHVDKIHGEWFSAAVYDKRPPNSTHKGSEWKAPYHNGRACLEIIHRLR
ncbi:MAG: AGE family epimerase/isomerase [Phycisphaerae bacterium]|nr:AGE family epimerase/isomerase [Phycisphaerae bacterium]